MTAFKFSKRSSKYVWLTLPGLASITLSLGWITAIAPSTQQATREETDWRREQQAKVDRQNFLADNQIYSDYGQLIFSDLRADQPDLKQQLIAWGNSPNALTYNDGQVVRLLDQLHRCMGYLKAGKGLYLEQDNPGMCGADIPDVPDLLDRATEL